MGGAGAQGARSCALQNESALRGRTNGSFAFPPRTKCFGEFTRHSGEVWTVCKGCMGHPARYICGQCCEELGAVYEKLRTGSPTVKALDMAHLHVCFQPPWQTGGSTPSLAPTASAELYEWTNGCPICVELTLPPGKDLTPDGYKDLKPNVVERSNLYTQVTWIKDDGSECMHDISIEVITMAPVLEKGATKQAFQYKYYDNEIHGEYLHFDEPPPLASRAPVGTPLWRLVRSSEGICLSLMWFDGLKSGWDTGNIPTAREFSGYYKDIRVAAGGQQGCLRTDRMGGQQGVAVGSLQALKRNLCSKKVVGATPRQHCGSVAIPMINVEVGGAVTSVRQLYSSVEDGHVVNLWGRSAPPQRGFVASGDRVNTMMSQPKHIEILHRFTAAMLTGAHVLLAMDTSLEAANKALVEFEVCRVTAEANAEVPEPPRTRRRVPETNSNTRGEAEHGVAALQLYIAAHSFTGMYRMVTYSIMYVGTSMHTKTSPLLCTVGVASASGGHRDSFGKGSTPSLENKMVVAMGPPVSVAPQQRATELLGALAYPRFKAATTCAAGADIEIHDLFTEFHFTAKAPGAGRVAFERASGKTFYQGVAVCDWSNRSRIE